MDEILSASAVAQARAIRERGVSSLELVELHLERIARVNPLLNAVVALDADRALETARDTDAALARGEELGPFAGVPFTAKDWLEAAGLACAAGFVARREFVPRQDATVVARMRAAGAILLGKTNVSENNEAHGATRNPYDPARSPGASSSGEASIIAAGGSPVGLGSDSGGSLRYPAHCCGIVTLKPTTGRVPLTGHFPRISPMLDPRTVIGPLSRHVEDLWPALSIIAGPDWRDPSVAPAPLPPPVDDMRGRRIGWFVELAGAAPEPSTAAAVTSAVEALRAAGASVEGTRLDRIDESLGLTRRYWARPESISLSEWRPPSPPRLDAETIERSLFEWDRFRRSMLASVRDFDAVICPAAEGPAPLHGSVNAQSYIYTLPFSLTGWPVVVLRAGTSPEGLPIGVQVVARPWQEHDAIAVASVIERAGGGWQPPPT